MKFLILVLLAACTTTPIPERSTEVKGLFETTASLTCKDVRASEEDLAVKGVKFLESAPFGAYLQIQKRTGGTKHAFSSSVDEFKPNDFAEKNYGDHAIFLGFLNKGGRVLVLLARNEAEDSRLELQDFRSQKVLFTSFALGVRITDGHVLPSKSGFWGIFNKESERAFGLFIKDVGNNKWRIDYALRDPQMAQAQVSLARDDVLFYASALPGKKEIIKIAATEVDPIAKKKFMQSNEIQQENGKLESWAISPFGNAVVMATVVGNSLIGKANLLITLHERVSLTEVWRKQFPLRDKHVGEPFILQKNLSHLTVGLVEWVTGEAFLEAFTVDAKSSKTLGLYAGLMPNSVVTEVYGADKKSIFSVRQKKDDTFLYDVCSLNF